MCSQLVWVFLLLPHYSALLSRRQLLDQDEQGLVKLHFIIVNQYHISDLNPQDAVHTRLAHLPWHINTLARNRNRNLTKKRLGDYSAINFDTYFKYKNVS